MQQKMPSNAQNFLSVLDRMHDVRVLVLGDIMLDRFVYGSVERISPESPVPILSIQREEYMLGGAGNALANLRGLGVKASLLSLIGKDENGENIRRQLKALNTSEEGLIEDEARPTTVKTRFLAGHQQLLRSDFEKLGTLAETLESAALEKLKTMTEKSDVILISDYGKGFLSDKILQEAVRLGRAQKKPVLVDPKGIDYKRYRGATLITPNRKELEEATQKTALTSDEAVTLAARQLITDCDLDAVIATRSQDGMSVLQKDGQTAHFPGARVEVFDVSGAGDTVIATIAAAIGAGASLEEAGWLANLAGGHAVTKVGTAPIRIEELRHLVETKTTGHALAAGLFDWNHALESVRRWRARGYKIGFTNGCFDILHKGHVAYLEDARRQCDRLIVGLNTDRSVKILKGEGRPYNDEFSRATVLNALSCVDEVVFFGADEQEKDNTASDLLLKLQPDLYFKGGDYRQEDIPESPAIQSYGGEIRLMPLYEGYSTTATLKKMSDEAA